MKQTILTLLLLLTALTGWCGGKREVNLVKQVTSSQMKTLPEKIDKLELQDWEFEAQTAQSPLCKSLRELLGRVRTGNYEYFTFVVNLQPDGQGIAITIDGIDPMDLTAAQRKQLAGNYTLAGGNFMMQLTLGNKALLKRLFKKLGDRTTFYRYWERVSELPAALLGTHVEARIAANGVTTLQVLRLNGQDQLKPSEPTKEEHLDYHGIDHTGNDAPVLEMPEN